MSKQSTKSFVSDAAIKGAEIKPLGKMCDGCAFKKGTEANGDEMTVELASQCLMWDGTFSCHKENPTDAEGRCVGFLYAKQYFATKFKKK